MEKKKIECLYRLLERAESEHDTESVAALRWAFSNSKQVKSARKDSSLYMRARVEIRRLKWKTHSEKNAS